MGLNIPLPKICIIKAKKMKKIKYNLIIYIIIFIIFLPLFYNMENKCSLIFISSILYLFLFTYFLFNYNTLKNLKNEKFFSKILKLFFIFIILIYVLMLLIRILYILYIILYPFKKIFFIFDYINNYIECFDTSFLTFIYILLLYFVLWMLFKIVNKFKTKNKKILSMIFIYLSIFFINIYSNLLLFKINLKKIKIEKDIFIWFLFLFFVSIQFYLKYFKNIPFISSEFHLRITKKYFKKNLYLFKNIFFLLLFIFIIGFFEYLSKIKMNIYNYKFNEIFKFDINNLMKFYVVFTLIIQLFFSAYFEEIIFRYSLYNIIRRYFYKKDRKVSNLFIVSIVSIIFAILHFDLYFFDRVISSFILFYLKDKGKSIIYPTTFHFFNNLIYLIIFKSVS